MDPTEQKCQMSIIFFCSSFRYIRLFSQTIFFLYLPYFVSTVFCFFFYPHSLSILIFFLTLLSFALACSFSLFRLSLWHSISVFSPTSIHLPASWSLLANTEPWTLILAAKHCSLCRIPKINTTRIPDKLHLDGEGKKRNKKKVATKQKAGHNGKHWLAFPFHSFMDHIKRFSITALIEPSVVNRTPFMLQCFTATERKILEAAR